MHPRPHPAAWPILSVCVLAACTASPAPAATTMPASPQPPPAVARRLAFSANLGNPNDFEVYLVGLDGSGLLNLTNNPTRDTNPLWSPDGRRIAFASEREPAGIYAMNPDGSGVTLLTDQQVTCNIPDQSLAWSPDGESFAFVTCRDGQAEIYRVAADGTGLVNLTDNPAKENPFYWSPDSRRILFTSDRDGNPELYVMNADGTSVKRLTDSPGLDAAQGWSPDGTQVIFISDRDGNPEVYRLNADGSDLLRLTNDPGVDAYAAWSPAGDRIAFMTNRDGTNDIYLVNPDGTGAINLTRSPVTEAQYQWAGDGSLIVANGFAGDTWSTEIIPADGSAITSIEYFGSMSLWP